MNKTPSYDIDCLGFETQAILIFARASARVRGHFSVAGDDLLFGILHMPMTDAAQALERCGITLKQFAKRLLIIPLMNIEGELPYTPHTDNIVRRSIAFANEEGRKHALPSDLLLALLELMRGGDEEADAIFYENADNIKMAIQTIKQVRTSKKMKEKQ